MKKLFIVVFTIVLMLAALLQNNNTPVVVAHGGQNNECDNATNVNPINGNLATYTAPSGQVVTGVCIKAGNDMFGDGHSDSLGNGIYNGTSGNPCYVVSGVGTQIVTVTRIGSGSTCKEISHIDVYSGTIPPSTPTPTPTDDPTPTPTDRVTPTPTNTPTNTPTPTPGGGNGGNNPTPTPTNIPTTTPTPTTGGGGQGGPGDGLSDGKSDGI